MILIETEDEAVDFVNDYHDEVFKAVSVDFGLFIPGIKNPDRDNPEHCTNFIIALKPLKSGGRPTPVVFTKPVGTYIRASGILEQLGITVEPLTIGGRQFR
jgi:hypothetical protein